MQENICSQCKRKGRGTGVCNNCATANYSDDMIAIGWGQFNATSGITTSITKSVFNLFKSKPKQVETKPKAKEMIVEGGNLFTPISFAYQNAILKYFSVYNRGNVEEMRNFVDQLYETSFKGELYSKGNKTEWGKEDQKQGFLTAFKEERKVLKLQFLKVGERFVNYKYSLSINDYTSVWIVKSIFNTNGQFMCTIVIPE